MESKTLHLRAATSGPTPSNKPLPPSVAVAPCMQMSGRPSNQRRQTSASPWETTATPNTNKEAVILSVTFSH